MTDPEPARHWDPQPGDGQRIRAHLLRQRGLDPLEWVRLDNGLIARVGGDAFGELGGNDDVDGG